MKCLVSHQCGSCQYIEREYQEQLMQKYQACQNLFQNINVHVHPVVGMDNPYHYRNKVIVAFNQKYEYGLYQESSHRIVPIQECLLHDNETHEVLEKIQIL